MSAGVERVHELLMPRLSDTMSEGVVRRWLKAAGDPVARGEPVAEIETDKVTVELEAPADGVLLAVLVPEDGAIPPGGLVALVGPAGATFSVPAPSPGLEAPSAPAPAAPPSPASEALRAAPVVAEPGGRRSVSPLARRLATDHGIALDALGPGSGPDGRLLRHDVERAIEARGVESAVTVPGAEGELVPLSPMQRRVAERLSAAKREIPHYYVDALVDVTALLELRGAAAPGDPAAVPLTAYLLRAVALALRESPRVNASWGDGAIVRHRAVDVGLAVALDDDGLVVPVVRGADALSLADVAARASDLVARARAGRLTPDDVGGASFTVSNLGGFGVVSFHAIVNPPESGILAVGAVRRVPAFVGEELVARDVVQLSLSADHRVFAGATAAAFLGAVARRLEAPQELLAAAPSWEAPA